jgi:hypothetical protein
MTTETLSDITRVEAEAQAAAAKAQVAAEVAKARADAARLRAEQERERANRDYLGLLTDEWPDARQQATEAVADAHNDLDLAVRNGDDVFAAYRGWVDASIAAWELDEGLGRMRRFHGVNMRETPAPSFAFGIDIAAIIDQVSLEAQDQAIVRIDARRASYLAGRKES